jgi:hypothetical protein
MVLESSSLELDKLVVAPRMEVILNVMNYARETADESVHQR